MRFHSSALALLMLPSLALAQDRGFAVNMGRGLDNGMSVGWTFKENWTLRPTLGIGYSDLTGFAGLHRVDRPALVQPRRAGLRLRRGGRLLRIGEQLCPDRRRPGPARRFRRGPEPGLRRDLAELPGSRLHDDPGRPPGPHPWRLRGFAEAAWQHTLSGEFAPDQAGQFSGNPSSRFGATLGISLRLQ